MIGVRLYKRRGYLKARSFFAGLENVCSKLIAPLAEAIFTAVSMILLRKSLIFTAVRMNKCLSHLLFGATVKRS